MAETRFVNGLIVKAPRENAPSFVKAQLSIKRQELIDWLTAEQGDWVNLDVKESKGGKWYAQVNDWKPEQRENSGTGKVDNEDEIPEIEYPNDPIDTNDIPFN